MDGLAGNRLGMTSMFSKDFTECSAIEMEIEVKDAPPGWQAGNRQRTVRTNVPRSHFTYLRSWNATLLEMRWKSFLLAVNDTGWASERV